MSYNNGIKNGQTKGEENNGVKTSELKNQA